jgi:sugar lactone lactonase YvrE
VFDGGDLDFVQSASLEFKQQDDAGAGIFFKPDGSKFFVLGTDEDKIYEYSLKDPWTLGDGTTGTGNAIDWVQSSSIQFKGGTGEVAPYGIHFKPDGTSLFVVGHTTKKIFEYSLSTPCSV